MNDPVPLLVRALTNLEPDERRAAIYEQAAAETRFPCWVERFPFPKGADRHAPGQRGDDLRVMLEVLRLAAGIPEMGDDYDPSFAAGYWSLWTEWGGTDHGPFWRRVEELEKESTR